MASPVLAIVRRDIHALTLAYRAVDRIVQSRLFEEAFTIEKDHRDLLEALDHANVEWIDNWMESTIKREIGELNLRDLRRKAAEYRIARYTAMSKDALIIALTQAVHHAREAQEAARRMPSEENRPGSPNDVGAGRTVPAPASGGGTLHGLAGN